MHGTGARPTTCVASLAIALTALAATAQADGVSFIPIAADTLEAEGILPARPPITETGLVGVIRPHSIEVVAHVSRPNRPGPWPASLGWNLSDEAYTEAVE